MEQPIVVKEVALEGAVTAPKEVRVYLDPDVALELEGDCWVVHWPKSGDTPERPYIRLAFPIETDSILRLFDLAIESARQSLSTINS